MITCDEGVRGGKVIPLKNTVDAALVNCPKVKRVFVSKRTGSLVNMRDKDFNLDQVRPTHQLNLIVPSSYNLFFLFFQEMEKQSTECQPEVLDSEDMLFLLYTSGSTGTPKGLVHTQAGYSLYTTVTHKVLL